MNERRYHHGDLANALRLAALELVAEHGVSGFTMKDAAERVGVSAAAPYRHFDDRESLLRAAAVEPYERFVDELRDTASTDPSERLADMMAAFVRWAAAEPAAHQILFVADLDKNLDTRIAALGDEALDLITSTATAIAGDEAPELMVSVYAIAQGHAVVRSDAALQLSTGNTELAELTRRAVRATARTFIDHS